MRLPSAMLLLFVASSAYAQSATDGRAGVTRSRVTSPLAPVASAIIPGSGQLMQGRNRALVYFAVEAIGWWKLARDVQNRSDQINSFKELARHVARARFSPNGPDGDWHYYEMLRDWKSSGDYSKVDGSIVPETDPLTFNGHTWVFDLATSANYNEALAKYEQQAYKADMLWSWDNAGILWNQFTRATESKNDANAAVNFDVTVLVLNHLISLIDAHSVFRLETHRTAAGGTVICGRVPW